MKLNNNIQEPMCSFEVSKLLKEKGFDIPCYKAFLYKIYEPSSITEENITKIKDATNYSDSHYEKYYRPTHGLAIEWIKVNFGIWIEIFWDVVNSKEKHVLNWKYSISKIGNMEFNSIEAYDFKSSEEAIEAALLYVLTNLIK